MRFTAGIRDRQRLVPSRDTRASEIAPSAYASAGVTEKLSQGNLTRVRGGQRVAALVTRPSGPGVHDWTLGKRTVANDSNGSRPVHDLLH